MSIIRRNVRQTHTFLMMMLVVILAASSLWATPAAAFTQSPAPVFINEIHYDNTGTDAGEAVEIAGPAGTNLSGWSIVLYNGTGGAVYDTDALSGSIPDQQNGFGTVVLNYPANGIQNGSPDAIALVNGTTVVQFLSYEGSFVAVGGPANGMTSTDIGVSENGSEPLGQSLQLRGTGTVYADFTWSAPATATFGALNTGQSFGTIVNTPISTSCGAALSTPAGIPASRAISASDADGTVTGAAISSAPVSGISLDAITPGTTLNATLTIADSVAQGTYTVEITFTSDNSPNATCTIAVTVNAPLVIIPIGQLQGSVSDSDNAPIHRSPYAPATGNSAGTSNVTVKAVIYQKTLARTAAGALQNGLFIQNTAATADQDPNSSDGIFVFLGSFSTLRMRDNSTYTPQIGDEIILTGRASEFFFLSQLSAGLFVEQVVRTGVDLSTELPAFEAFPPDNLDDANRYWERREGMRGMIVPGSVVVDSRDVFASTADAEIWVIHPNHPVAQRAAEYSRRIFRDPHPLDNVPEQLFDDGNGYRTLLGSFGVKATVGDSMVMLAPARTYDTVTNMLLGGVYYSFSKYQIQPSEQPVLNAGVDPALNNPPQVFNRFREYSVSVYNVENLYDYRDDPFDGCDFIGNTGCPGVSPPFDYAPSNDADYQERVGLIAQQIITDLHAPDIILVQEAEDQDICTIANDALSCGSTNNADGKPDTLQELATRILSLGGPNYDAAFDRNGADARGIVSAYLYRTDRVELLPADASDPVFGSSPSIQYRTASLSYNSDVQNPKALNAVLPNDIDRSTGTDGSNVFTRAAQAALFRVWSNSIGQGESIQLYTIVNHFSSTPNGRVGQRREQAAYNAAIVEAIRTIDANARIIVGGDLNVMPRPDDPFSPGHPLFPSDQLAPLYNAGLTNLYDTVLAEHPETAYSYIFQGQTQVLDQLFTSALQFGDLVQVREAHINADWPADYPGDGARGLSDHDPQVARFLIDTTAPSVSAAVTGSVRAGCAAECYDGSATVTLTASEPATIMYRINGGDWLTYSTAFDISTEGANTVEFYALDLAENQSATQTITVKVTHYPVLTVLDSFNRRNGGLGRNWGTLYVDSYTINNNQGLVGVGAPAYWRGTANGGPIFGTNQAVALTLVNPVGLDQGILLKVQPQGSGAIGTYKYQNGTIEVWYNSSTGLVTISTYQRNVGWRDLGAYAAVIQPGDVLGAVALADGTIKAYVNCELIGYVNTPWLANKGGLTGIWYGNASGARFDNFQVGTIVP